MIPTDTAMAELLSDPWDQPEDIKLLEHEIKLSLRQRAKISSRNFDAELFVPGRYYYI